MRNAHTTAHTPTTLGRPAVHFADHFQTKEDHLRCWTSNDWWFEKAMLKHVWVESSIPVKGCLKWTSKNSQNMGWSHWEFGRWWDGSSASEVGLPAFWGIDQGYCTGLSCILLVACHWSVFCVKLPERNEQVKNCCETSDGSFLRWQWSLPSLRWETYRQLVKPQLETKRFTWVNHPNWIQLVKTQNHQQNHVGR